MKLSDCIPKDKHDLDAVANATALGYPAIDPILPQLLEWLQDGNWSVAGKVMTLLAKAGPEISRHLSAILNSDDDFWKYWILDSPITDALSQEAWLLIEPDVVRIARHPTGGEKLEDVDELAKNVLAQRTR